MAFSMKGTFNMYLEENIEAISCNSLNWVTASVEFENFNVLRETPAFFEFGFKDDIRVIKDELDTNYTSRVVHKEILFVFGIYSIKEINKLYKTKNEETLIVVIEPNVNLFSYTLHHRNLSVFRKRNICLFVDNKVENIITFLQPLVHELNIVKLMKKINFYFTDYYRKYDVDISENFVKWIRQTIVSTINSFGNDIEDSLIGLKHNLKNLKHILDSKDTTQLLNLYKDTPAIIVSAGPSLNKNIRQLKNAEGKAIIIAVDTIVSRLLKENIIPDFICSIERIPEVYEYFYQDKIYPKEITLVGPSVLDSRIFEEYKGNVIIPFRNEIAETEWLQRILGQPVESGFSMGSSCAHVAFGLAEHLGCSPLILVGQDLAYGENLNETHASGTFYDEKERKEEGKGNQEYVEGYFGGKVLTTKIWLQFKTWFEKRIRESNLHVIDATEGGAKIQFTENETLESCILKYCHKPSENIISTLNVISKYPITLEVLKQNLEKEIAYYDLFLENVVKYFNFIIDLEINHDNLMESNEKMKIVHQLIKDALSNKLIMHNLQSTILNYLWAYNSREQIVSKDNLQQEKNEQVKLLGIMAKTIYEIKILIADTLERIDDKL